MTQQLSLFRPRTGLPEVCPMGRANPVNGGNCLHCPYHKQDHRLHWRCDHPDYQNALGVHFCQGCGIELSPNGQSHGWVWCGGPVEECRREMFIGLAEDAEENKEDL